MSQKHVAFSTELFVGARLGAVRTESGITLEQAARDTRIRVQRLREIEVDDFSGFAHPTYARLFLLDYANYLGVPADDVRPLLPDQTKAAAGGYQYLDALGGTLEDRNGPARRKGRMRHLLRLLAAALLIFAVLVVGLYFLFTIKKIERITPRPAQGTEIGVDVPTPAPEPSPTATPEPPAAAESLWNIAPPDSTNPTPPPGLDSVQ